MTTQQMIDQLAWTEMIGGLDRQTRAMLRAEREDLMAALQSRDRDRIAAARKEAVRVATMWGVWRVGEP